MKKYLRLYLRKRSTWVALIFWICIAFVSLYDLARAPIGFFADEAGIGVAAWRLLHGDWSHAHNFGFYYHLGEYYLGLLGPLSTIPFVFIFGLSEWSVRAASVCYGLITLFIWSKVMDKLNLKGKYVALFLIWSIPLFFHPMRTQFALTLSLLYLSLSLLIYISMDRPSRVGSFGVGFLAVASGYSHISFIVLGMLWAACIVIGYIVRFHHHKKQLVAMICYLCVGLLVAVLPYAIAMGQEPLFLKRFTQKNAGSHVALVSKEKVLFMIGQYPRYFDPEYLLKRGEIDSPGSGGFRHSISGFGQFSPLHAGFVVLGLICLAALLRYRQKRHLLFVVLALFAIYPITDILTQDGVRPPYTYSIYILVLPAALCIMYAVDSLIHLTTSLSRLKRYMSRLVIVGGIVYGLVYFTLYMSAYITPTPNTVGFYGWQWGPREIISYFKLHESEYDELYMQGAFNAGDIFVPFYDPEGQCRGKCRLGGFERYNPNKRQLFALQASDLDSYMSAVPQLEQVHALVSPADAQKKMFYFMTSR